MIIEKIRVAECTEAMLGLKSSTYFTTISSHYAQNIWFGATVRMDCPDCYNTNSKTCADNLGIRLNYLTEAMKGIVIPLIMDPLKYDKICGPLD